MRSWLQKLILSLLIAVMCANCTLPALAAAEMSDRERKYFEEGIISSKTAFHKLYEQIWKKRRLDKELDKAIEEGVNKKMDAMLPGTRGLGTMFFKKVAEDAQELVIEQFTPYFREFIYELEERFGIENNLNIDKFYEAIAKEEKFRSDNKAVSEYLDNKINETLDKNAEKLHTQIEVSLTSKGIWTVAEGGASLAGAAAGSLSLYLISKVSQEKLSEFFAGTIFKAFGEKLAISPHMLGGIGLVGGLWLAYSQGKKALSAILNAPKDLKKQLKAKMSEYLKTQLPKDYWNVMEEKVRNMFEQAYEIHLKNLDEAKDFANQPKVKALVGNAAEEQ